MNLGRTKYIFIILSSLSLIVIYLPIFGIVFSSFFKTSIIDNNIYELSLDGFYTAFQNDSLLQSLLNSTFTALLTSTTTTILALLMSFSLQDVAKKFLIRWRQLFYLPLMLPEIVIGISLLIWFVFIHLSLGKISLLLSHISFTLPYAVVILTLGIEGLDANLLEAAKDLGANSKKIFTHITLPLLKPSLLGIFLLSFVISFDDFLISYFTAGAGNDTLPMKLYSMMRFGLSTELKAISTLILFISLVITFLLFKLTLRQSANSLQLKPAESLNHSNF